MDDLNLVEVATTGCALCPAQKWHRGHRLTQDTQEKKGNWPGRVPEVSALPWIVGIQENLGKMSSSLGLVSPTGPKSCRVSSLTETASSSVACYLYD